MSCRGTHRNDTYSGYPTLLGELSLTTGILELGLTPAILGDRCIAELASLCTQKTHSSLVAFKYTRGQGLFAPYVPTLVCRDTGIYPPEGDAWGSGWKVERGTLAI